MKEDMLSKKFGFAIITIGIIALGIFISADLFDAHSYRGTGAAQLLGIQVALILIILGFGLVITDKQGAKSKIQFKTILNKTLDFPISVWIVCTFIIVSFFFFLKPMFLNSKLQIDYIYRYIPDSSRIGTDIRTIMTAIEGWLVSGNLPYTNGLLAYPPLMLIIFSPLVLIGFPTYFRLITYATLISYIFVTLIIPLAQKKGEHKSIIYIFSLLGILSYGFQFELERGQFNVIAFLFCYAAIYLFHAHPKLRYFAYILFSISVQLKVYTLIFIILFTDNWSDWKSAVQRIIRVIIFNFLLLFLLGFNTFKSFIQSLSTNQFNYAPWNGSSIQSFVFRFSKTGYGIFSENIMLSAQKNASIFEFALFLFFGICFLLQIIYAIYQKTQGLDPYLFVTCVIGALVIPTISNDYKLPLLIGPMSILLTSLPIQDNVPKKFISILLIFSMSLAFWSTFYPFKVKPDILHNNLPVLFILLVSITIYRLLVQANNSALQV